MIRFEKRKMEEIPKSHTLGERHTDGTIANIVEVFAKNSDECVECFYDNEYANANNFRKAFQNACVLLGIKNVNAVIRGNRVFLVKGDRV